MFLPVSNNLQWPLSVDYGISATFGEFRHGHFHAGIDLKTGGKDGLPVYASASGTIYRINIRKRGYGKAIYIRHKNGLITVYAHLQTFEEKILHLESILAEKQIDKGKYPGNIFLSIPVKSKQLIAFSGETGAGLPHLHFEVRRNENEPINPFSAGLVRKDRKKPVIQSISFKPLLANSFISFSPEIKSFSRKIIKHIDPAQLPVLVGSIEPFIATFDRIGASNKVGIFKLIIKIDGKILNSYSFNKLSYSTNHRVGLIYDLNTSGFSPTHYNYRLGGILQNKLSFYHKCNFSCGLIKTSNLKKGKHIVTVEASDFAGNRDIIKFPFQSLPSYTNLFYNYKNKTLETKLLNLSLHPHGTFLTIKGKIGKSSSFPTILVSSKSSKVIKIPLIIPKKNTFTASIDLYDFVLDNMSLITIMAVDTMTFLKGKRKILRKFRYKIQYFETGKNQVFHANNITLMFRKKTLFSNLFLTAKKIKPNFFSNLIPVGFATQIKPRDVSFDKPALLKIIYNTSNIDQKKIGIYSFDYRHHRWNYLVPENDSKNSGSLNVSIRYLSTFCLFIDNVSPKLSLSKIPSNEFQKGTLLHITAIDKGMGIDDETILSFIDNKKCLSEYDPDRKWITIPLPIGLKEGKHQLKVSVSDRGGNKAKPFFMNFQFK